MPFRYSPPPTDASSSTASYYYVRPHFIPSDRRNDRFPALTAGNAVRVSEGRHSDGPLDLNDCHTYTYILLYHRPEVPKLLRPRQEKVLRFVEPRDV